MEELGLVISNSELGAGRSKGVVKCLQGGGPVGVAVWGGDMGPHSKDGLGPEKFSKQGREEDHREASAAAKDGWEIGIPDSGRGTEGSGVRGDKEVGHKDAEHGRSIYCDATDSGPL